MRVQHNIASMNSYRNFGLNNSKLGKNLEKLSSGYAINRAGDDAAGLAVSEKMRWQTTGLEAAIKNAKDGIGLIQTAEGALTEVHDMLNRMNYLAEQASNETYDDDDLENLNAEARQLMKEIDRIASSADFNGVKLLDGTIEGKKLQIGVEASDTLTLSLSAEGTAAADKIANMTVATLFGDASLKGDAINNYDVKGT
ncbi:MAG: flagellin, partial [Oscillospiraceae bacterium]|nr:flagellin [Oscillospiraceae bacterium]